MKVKNLGQKALIDLGLSLGAVAEKIDCTVPAVGTWRRGEVKPRPATRKKLRRAYGIAVGSWDRSYKPTEKKTKSTTKKKPGKKTTRGTRICSPVAGTIAPITPDYEEIEDDEQIPPYPDEPPEGSSTLDTVRHTLACIRHDIKHRDLTVAARSKLRSDEARTQALLAKLEREEELSEDRYVRNHPAYREHCDRILRAVKPYPKAAQAIAKALKS